MGKNIKPNIWGPYGWKFMHYVSFGYPENPSIQDKKNYKNFYYSIQNILPCKRCQLHYQHNLKEYPIDNSLKDRESLIKWVIDIHNKVNKETGKKEYEYEEAKKLYQGENQQLFNHCLKAIVLIIILYFVYIYLKSK